MRLAKIINIINALPKNSPQDCFLNGRLQVRYQFACKTKKQTNKKVNLFFMVRVTGLEPVRRETHAPQTCLSAYSSTLANIKFLY